MITLTQVKRCIAEGIYLETLMHRSSEGSYAPRTIDPTLSREEKTLLIAFIDFGQLAGTAIRQKALAQQLITEWLEEPAPEVEVGPTNEKEIKRWIQELRKDIDKKSKMRS